MSENINLSFVNGGKEFILRCMTVKRQEEYMEAVEKLEKTIKDEDKRAREVSKHLVLETLKIIDQKVTLDNINDMHPNDYIELTNLIWEQGRELFKGEKKDFRNKK